MRNITCKKCGWVSFEVSRKHAEDEVKNFNIYFNELPLDKRELFYGNKPANIHFYEHCMFCNGSYKNFRDFVDGDAPDGCTLNPIINRNE